MKSFFAKRMSIVLLLVCMFFALAGTAQAQEKSGVFGPGGTSANEGPFEFEYEGGVKIIFNEIKQSQRFPDYFYVSFTCISQEDMMLKISSKDGIAYDNRGNEFVAYPETWIGNVETSERRIIGGVPTEFLFHFHKRNLQVADLFARIDLNIMGKVITIRNVPTTK